MKLKRYTTLLLALLLAATLTGCGFSGDKTQPIETDWSRGLAVGTANLREPASMALDDQEQAMHLVWAQKGEYGIDIHYALVDRDAGVQVSGQLNAGLFLPRLFRILITSQGEIHLLTRAKSNKDSVSGVYHMQISENGELMERPALVTPPEQSVNSYDAAMLLNEEIVLVWESGRETGGGLYHRTLNRESDDTVENDPMRLGPVGQLNPRGQSPSMALDQTNVLHLGWRIDDGERGLRDVYYAEFIDAKMDASEGALVTSIPLNDSADLSKPVVGYDDGHIYVFWHSDIVGGPRAGTGITDFAAFPKGKPQQAVTRGILIPDTEGGSIISPLNQLNYTPVTPGMALKSSSYVIYPAPASANAPELPLLLSAKTTFRIQEEMQPVMAVLVDGVQVGYAPVARTGGASFFPVGTRDDSVEAYTAWIDYRGGGRYPVFLSSTSPAWKTGAMRTTARDVSSDVSRELAFGLLTVITLIPMTLFVFLLSFFWIVILLLLGRAQNLNTRGGRFQFGTAVVIFYVIKTAAFAPLLRSPSLLRTMSQPWAGMMMFALPALIFALAAIPTAIYIRRADPPGLPTSFFLFAIVDLFFTVLVYGPTLYT